jgi:ketosteroid isomerase-like protein
MDQTTAKRFAQSWLKAWNSHDADAVLAHFADEVVFTSPVAASMIPESAGVLRGKAALRAYWTAALARVPDLRFEVLGVYAGVDHLVINYRNHLGGLVCEVLRFDGEQVVEGAGTYLSEDAAAASGISG